MKKYKNCFCSWKLYTFYLNSEIVLYWIRSKETWDLPLRAAKCHFWGLKRGFVLDFFNPEICFFFFPFKSVKSGFTLPQVSCSVPSLPPKSLWALAESIGLSSKHGNRWPWTKNKQDAFPSHCHSLCTFRNCTQKDVTLDFLLGKLKLMTCSLHLGSNAFLLK